MILKTLGGLELLGASLTRSKPLLILVYLVLEGPKDRHFLADLFYRAARNPLASLRVALNHIREDAPGALSFDDNQVSAVLDSDIKQLQLALESNDYSLVCTLYSGEFLMNLKRRGLGAELEDWVYASRDFLVGQVREAFLRLAEASALEQDFFKASQLAESAVRLTNLSDAKPESLKRLYILLSAGKSLLAEELHKELEVFDLAVTLTTQEARASFKLVEPAAQHARHNLESLATSFVGRDFELLEIARLLADPKVKLLSLVGLGGNGKTRLSLQAGHEQLAAQTFQEVRIVYLEDQSSAAGLLKSIAEALGLTSSASFEEISTYLKAKSSLLILDNFEQLTNVAYLVADLLRACPELKCLVSSREALGVEHEWLLELNGLYVPETPFDAEQQESLSLFEQRAKRANLNFKLNRSNLNYVHKICRLVNGSPLGIELAAAWVNLLNPEDIANELEQNLDLLSSQAKHTNEKHKSIRATFEASWQNLNKLEQNLLKSLAVFTGSFTREAASTVTQANLPLLMSLKQKSLLSVSQQGRFNMHPLLHRYSLEKLSETPKDLQEAQDNHADFFKNYSLAKGPELHEHSSGQNSKQCLEQLSQDIGNLEKALEHALNKEDIHLLSDLIWPIRVFWFFKGDRSKSQAFFSRCLALNEMKEEGLAQSKLFITIGTALKTQGKLEQAQHFFKQSATLSKKLNDPETLILALTDLGRMAILNCNYQEAQAHYQEAQALAKQSPYPLQALSLECSLTELDYLKGNYDRAAPQLEKILLVFKQQGHIWQTSHMQKALANLYRDKADYSKAEPLYQESLAQLQELSEHAHVAVLLKDIALLKLYQGKLNEAQDTLKQALNIHNKQSATLHIALCQQHLADIALQKNQPQQAQERLHKSLISLKTLNAKAPLLHLLDSFTHLFALTQKQENARFLASASQQLRQKLCIGQAEYRKQLNSKLLGTPSSKPKPLGVNMPLNKLLDYALDNSLKLNFETLQKEQLEP